ncbi:DUF2634 domain-containing protein [Paenibacillus sp. TAB 01]|uniref:DUF2634 domain-containing protein n=1 Tax=Paenibacillus sp. TAB 01 TaxID=3368988 RepID=UPI003750ECD7
MIPQGGINRNVQTVQQPSKTYRIDPVSNRIVGMTDGMEAVKQAVMKILQTERFEFLIYSGNHGSELSALPGSSSAYVETELGRRIRAALLQDDRIKDVQDIQISVAGDEALATFTVISQYGNIEMTKEV